MDQSARTTATKQGPGAFGDLESGGGVPGAEPPGKSGKDKAPSLFKERKQDGDVFGPDYGYRRIRFHKDDEINPYADAEDARHALDPRTKAIIVMVVVLLVVFFLSATLPTQVLSPTARTNHSLAVYLKEFGMQVQGLLAIFLGQETFYSMYVWEIVAAGLAGAALGVSGGVYQGAMKNALASPSTLGVTQGGALGLIIYGMFVSRGSFTGSMEEYSAMLATLGPVEYAMESFGGFISSLIACFAIVGLCLLIAYLAGRGRVTNVSLIIAGQVFTSVIGVAISWIRYYLVEVLGDPYMQELVANAQSATFMGAYTAASVAVFAIPTIVCMIVIFRMSPRLSLLAFNDDEARTMGISTAFTRNLMVGLCTALTALVVSYVGMIGFVGFMVPHMARRFIGPDFRYLLPACALLGAILVVAVHYIANMGIPGFVSGSVGVFTSILGCIMFLVIALRSRGNKHAEWF